MQSPVIKTTTSPRSRDSTFVTQRRDADRYGDIIIGRRLGAWQALPLQSDRAVRP